MKGDFVYLLSCYGLALRGAPAKNETTIFFFFWIISLSTNCFVTGQYLWGTKSSKSHIRLILHTFFLYLTGYAESKSLLRYFPHLVLILQSLCLMYFFDRQHLCGAFCY